MHDRSLPLFPTRGSYVSYLESKGDLNTMSASVSMRLEITEIHRRVIAAGGPGLRLTQALDQRGALSGLPVVAILLARPGASRGAWAPIWRDFALCELLAWMR